MRAADESVMSVSKSRQLRRYTTTPTTTRTVTTTKMDTTRPAYSATSPEDSRTAGTGGLSEGQGAEALALREPEIPLVPGERQGLGQTGVVLGSNLSPARQAGDLKQALNLSEHQSL